MPCSRETVPARTYPANAFSISSQIRSGAMPSTSPSSTARVHSSARSLPPRAARTITVASKTTRALVASLSDEVLRFRRVWRQVDLSGEPAQLVGDRRSSPLLLSCRLEHGDHLGVE